MSLTLRDINVQDGVAEIGGVHSAVSRHLTKSKNIM